MIAAWDFIGGLRSILAGLACSAVVYVYASLWMVPAAARDARAGYVLETRAMAAEARAAELERQVKANALVIDAYQTQVRNDTARDDARSAEIAKLIAEHEAKQDDATRNARALTPADIEFLRR